MNIFFGYFDLGLRAMNAARLGMQIAGDNISHAQTPGYVRRRLELTSGFPVRVQGGLLDSGVEVQRVRRMEDRFLQAHLERELGSLGESDERLRGLRDVEGIFGDLDAPGLASSLEGFFSSFNQLAPQPESAAQRRTALAAADSLARELRGAAGRLADQRRSENQAVEFMVGQVNALADQLATLNQEIHAAEVDGGTAAPLRDERTRIVEQLTELTGGTGIPGPNGKVAFQLPGGPTLVTGEDPRSVALHLQISRDASGIARILAGPQATDVTARLRTGRLGGLLRVRDEAITAQISDLNSIASDLATRVNALTTGARDLDGNAGGPLFGSSGPAPIDASNIQISAAIFADPDLLAVSSSGAPGDGSVATAIGSLREAASAALGGKTSGAFLAESLSRLGGDIARTDVARNVSVELSDGLKDRREAVSGVSLDEEAMELMRNQQAYEAAARFLGVINQVTQSAINLFRE